MSSFHSALVALALVALTTAIGCAQNKDGEGSSRSYCEHLPSSPSCVAAPPPPSVGSHLTLPTGSHVLQNETDPGTPFPATIELVRLVPAPGTMAALPYKFQWEFKATMQTMANRFEGVTFEFFPSNDGVIPSGDRFTNGSVGSASESIISNFTTDSFKPMGIAFKHVIVKALWLRGGVGYQYATHVFRDINLGRYPPM